MTETARTTPITLINLDRSPDRLAEFSAHNQGTVGFERFSGVDGKSINRVDLLHRGLLAPDHQYVDGAIGCALSHLTLWHRVVADNKSMTICEDDAILNFDFSRITEILMDFCRDSFDFIWWGWNLDAPILYDMFPGGIRCAAFCAQGEVSGFTETFKKATLYPSLHRLYEVYGTMCYTVSPRGAKKLVEQMLPIGRPRQVFSGANNRTIDNLGIDQSMSAMLPNLNALVCIPPLAISKHEVTRSTIADARGQRRKNTSVFLIE